MHLHTHPLSPCVLQFRLVARRGDTSSEPSAPTRQLLPGLSGDKLQEAPAVEAIGSASYHVSWRQNVGTCRPRLSWNLLLVRPPVAMYSAAAGASEASSELVASSLQDVSSFDAAALRCRPPGCAFRVQALGVAGFNGPADSATSSYLPANPLPPRPFGAVRFEAKTSVVFASAPNPAAEFSARLGAARACALDRCPSERISIREIYAGEQYVLFDLLPPSTAIGSGAAAAADDPAVRDALAAAAASLDIIDQLTELRASAGPAVGASVDAAVVIFKRSEATIGTQLLLLAIGVHSIVGLACVGALYWRWRSANVRSKGGVKYSSRVAASDEDSDSDGGASDDEGEGYDTKPRRHKKRSAKKKAKPTHRQNDSERETPEWDDDDEVHATPHGLEAALKAATARMQEMCGSLAMDGGVDAAGSGPWSGPPLPMLLVLEVCGSHTLQPHSHLRLCVESTRCLLQRPTVSASFCGRVCVL